MQTYIAIIGEYRHNDFHPSYWNASPVYTRTYRILAEDMDDARFRVDDFCNVYTESKNEFSKNTYENYSKDEDECVFKVININSVDSLQEIV